jgi:D-alanyl-lipoteichoic acid acyltransferase DltB (MBOAT superfamily)
VLFNTLAYARFFAVVFVAAWLLVRFRKTRVAFLLLASYVFYAHWDHRFVALIWISSTADWLLGNAIARAATQTSRKRWLALTVVLNLGLLGFFKYANFGVDSARLALEALGYHPPPLSLEIALPVGISFFTFESMSYVIDVYRRQIEPHPSYLEYLTFVAFFPHLVAGPIVRPRDLLPQLAAPARFVPEAGCEALYLIALGLLKKVAIGDYLALNLVDRVFDAPAQYSALECYAAVVGYALQIYCDFSGYTDIAIGSALLLGVRFPPNFAAPYTAHDLIDFWRRWHISLSTWLRDYLYVPLGGNRRGALRTYANLLITMLLGGLWHGASWNFVLWGGVHGLGLALNRFLRDRFGFDPGRLKAWQPLSVFVTFHFVTAAWVLFRAQNLDAARVFFGRIATLTTYHPNLDWRVLCVMALGLFGHFLPEGQYARLKAWFVRLPAPGQAVFLFGVLVVLRTMTQAQTVPFVYFQF